VYSFGPFTLDERTRTLIRDGATLSLSDRYLELLLAFVSRPGQIVSKDSLIEAAWKDVAVGDNSLEQAISTIRRKLGPTTAGRGYIETVPRRGYRFVAEVTRAVFRESDATLEAMLAPHRAFVEGRAALETLGLDAIKRAQGVFEQVIAFAPEYASAHIGLANALALIFESNRTDEFPVSSELRAAETHARDACRLDAESGDAWATLAFVLSRSGVPAEAIAAARRAIALEPDNWRHHLRLAYVAWGEERLRAARRALNLLPGLALAHWLAATVHVARQALDEAERELSIGTAAQDSQQEGARFAGVGLHYLLGLVRLTRGNEPSSLAELARELEFEKAGHVYSREACANTWCAIAAIRMRQGDMHAAMTAFERALERVPSHPLALAIRNLTTNGTHRTFDTPALMQRLANLRQHGGEVEAAMVEAIVRAVKGEHGHAAHFVYAVLQRVHGGSAGWIVPVEPFLNIAAHRNLWAPVTSLLRSRAA
jgi:DNA-binding winged helix-turn-helix (wHTH) protein/cytochrome c-type biogenesis protein CcmH/NrfG